jgi:hypothetical protein
LAHVVPAYHVCCNLNLKKSLTIYCIVNNRVEEPTHIDIAGFYEETKMKQVAQSGLFMLLTTTVNVIIVCYCNDIWRNNDISRNNQYDKTMFTQINLNYRNNIDYANTEQFLDPRLAAILN